MKQTSLFIVMLFFAAFSNTSNAQGYYFNFGQNFTKYDYKNSQGQRNSNLKSDKGVIVDFGLQWVISSNEKWHYKAGLSFQQFNAKGHNGQDVYSWVANYLGIQNSLSYAIYSSDEDRVKFKLNGGFTASKIIKGEQMRNNISYDLTKETEFKGLFLQPHIGVENEIFINEFTRLGLGYRFSKAIRSSKPENESLNFINNAFYINFKYLIN
jgi:hypothetical protein